eukprot:5143697-Amphidinium_carterae.5
MTLNCRGPAPLSTLPSPATSAPSLSTFSHLPSPPHIPHGQVRKPTTQASHSTSSTTNYQGHDAHNLDERAPPLTHITATHTTTRRGVRDGAGAHLHSAPSTALHPQIDPPGSTSLCTSLPTTGRDPVHHIHLLHSITRTFHPHLYPTAIPHLEPHWSVASVGERRPKGSPVQPTPATTSTYCFGRCAFTSIIPSHRPARVHKRTRNPRSTHTHISTYKSSPCSPPPLPPKPTTYSRSCSLSSRCLSPRPLVPGRSTVPQSSSTPSPSLRASTPPTSPLSTATHNPVYSSNRLSCSTTPFSSRSPEVLWHFTAFRAYVAVIYFLDLHIEINVHESHSGWSSFAYVTMSFATLCHACTSLTTTTCQSFTTLIPHCAAGQDEAVPGAYGIEKCHMNGQPTLPPLACLALVTFYFHSDDSD